MKKKTLALLLSVVLILGCAIGGTLAWLTDKTNSVKNTFTDSDIEITLTEDKGGTNKKFQMIPGFVIDKNPTVSVGEESEDCWLFVKITESSTPDLNEYIAYAIDGQDETGWTIIDDNDSNENTIVIARKVYKDADEKTFSILGKGSYTYDNGTTDSADDITVSWEKDQVGVKPEVTKAMMEAISDEKEQPTLTFEAYAVQLYSTNQTEFTADAAWAQAIAMK